MVEAPTAPVQSQLPHATNNIVVVEKEQLPQELHGRFLMPWAMSWLPCAAPGQARGQPAGILTRFGPGSTS